MDALETLVRDTLVDRAADAPADHTLLDAVLHKPRRRRWPVIGLAAAAVVVGVAVSVAVIHAPEPTTPAGPSSVASPGIAAPSGYRWLSRSRVAVAVPIGLPILHGVCMMPAQYVFEPTARGVTIGCPSAGLPAKDQTLTVRIDSHSERRPVPSPPTEPRLTDGIALHGLTGRIGYGKLGRYPGAAGRLVLGRLKVTITVTAPTDAEVQTILLSARPAADLLGCATQLRPDRGPKRVPLDPLDADACVYSTLGNPTRSLIGVRHLTGSRLRQILRIDRDLIAQTLLVNPQQRYVVLEVHYSARRNVTLGFLSGQAARAVISG